MRLRLPLIASLVMCGCSDAAPPSTGGIGVGALDEARFTCPMHPSIRAAAPGACPICNMALTAVSGDGDSGAVVVDALRRQRFGVRTDVVQSRALVREIRAPGTVRWDKSRLLDISVRGDTWIEHLHVLEPGTTVRRGQSLALVYSPMLYAAQREFVASRGSERELSKHERLKLLGLSPSQINKLALSGVVSETTDLLAPEAGVVVEIEAIEGTHLMEGTRFARIARLDQVWIEAEVFEEDVALVKAGAALSVRVPGSAAPLTGVVDRVEPWLDPSTRRAKIRATVANPDGLLLPNMYVDVTLRADLGDELAVPVEAVIATGERRIVFVDEGAGRLVPRDVRVGRRAGEWLEVHHGLASGDKVVTSGAFLIASESRIRASETYWGRAPGQDASAAGAAIASDTGNATDVRSAAAATNTDKAGDADNASKAKASANEGEGQGVVKTPGLVVLAARHQAPAAWTRQLTAVIDAYLATKDALVKSDATAAAAAAARVRVAVGAVDGTAGVGPPADAWAKQASVLRAAAEQIEKAKAIEAQRDALFALSEAAYAAAWSFEHTKKPLFLQVCPMAHEDKGGAPWLSVDADIKNPYFGDAMLTCGETKRALR